MPKRRLLPLTIALSLWLHGMAYAALEAAPPPAANAAPRKSQLRFDVVAKARPAVPDPPPPAPRPEPAPRAAPKPPPRTEPAPAPPPAAAEPESIAGVTLAGDGSGSGFAMPLASGGSLEPTRVPAPSPAPPNQPVPTPPAPRGPARVEPALVAVGDLSARPAPPALGPALERNYPSDARRRGQSGSAKVRARIDPDGVVRRVSLLDESAPGFGSACTKTLNGSRWAAPKDKAGRAVATEIRYTCRFVVE